MSEEKIGSGYYVTIPMKVLLDEDLTPKARLLFGVIANLSNQRGYCFASNIYIAELTGWHRDTISEFVAQLISKNYLVRFDEATKNGLERRLFLTGGSEAKPPKRVRRNGLDGLGGVALQNNIRLNNKENITEESKDSSFKKPVLGREKQLSIEPIKKGGGPVYVACVEHWLKVVHPGWGFKAVDGKAMKGIIQQMTVYSTRKRQQEMGGDTLDYSFGISFEHLINFFKHFCQSLPEFYRSQTLTVLNSKFDSIIEQIKTSGKVTGKKLDPNNPRDANAILGNLIRSNSGR